MAKSRSVASSDNAFYVCDNPNVGDAASAASSVAGSVVSQVASFTSANVRQHAIDQLPKAAPANRGEKYRLTHHGARSDGIRTPSQVTVAGQFAHAPSAIGVRRPKPSQVAESSGDGTSSIAAAVINAEHRAYKQYKDQLALQKEQLSSAASSLSLIHI